MRNRLFFAPVGILLSAFALAASAAATDNQVLVSGIPGAEVKTVDVQAEVQRLPAEMRAPFLANKDGIQQMVHALFVRRAMAAHARSLGVADDPEIAAAARIAADKVISDAYLAKFNAQHRPDPKLIEAQVKAHYAANKDSMATPEEVHLAHILVKGKDEAAKQKAEKLLLEAKAGADFAKLAKDNSEDPGSAARGGDLGFIARGRMVPEFEKAGFALSKPGEFAPVVESPFGYHVIKFIERKPAVPKTFEEARPELEKQFTQKALAAVRDAEVEKVTEKAKFDEKALEAFLAKSQAK